MSILGADFGSVHTRVVLIDLVDGLYQLVARAEVRTTDDFPVGDITVGLDRALTELSEATGRTFTGQGGVIITPERPDRSGIDTFVATASIGRPLRAVIVGLMPDISIISALRAVSTTYIQVAAQVHLDDGRSEEERLNAILLNYPDIIFLVGGTEDGARAPIVELAEIIKLAVSLTDKNRRPSVIFAGNSKVAETLKAKFDGLTEFLVAQNIRPSIDEENLTAAQFQLARAFDIYKEQRTRDFATIAGMSKNGLLPTAQGYGRIVGYLGKIRPEGVIAVDVGSAASVLAASYKGQVTTAIRTDLGLGHNAISMLDAVGVEAVRRWLPFNISVNELRNYAGNKILRPPAVPNTLRETYIEHAFLRAGMQALLRAALPNWKSGQEAKDFSVIVGAGAALTGVGNAGYTSLLLLDTLQPSGVSTLYADPFALIPILGSVAVSEPEAVVQVLDGNNLEPIAITFSISGAPRLDKPAVKVKITLKKSEEVIEQTVNGGHIWRYPLPLGESAEVQIRSASRGLSIAGKRSLTLKVDGSLGGLIFDARGRPLPLDMTAIGRASQIPIWLSDATGDPLLEIDPAWLQEIEESEPEIQTGKAASSAKESAPKKERRGLFGRRQKQDKIDEPALDEPLEDDEPTGPKDELKELRDALS